MAIREQDAATMTEVRATAHLLERRHILRAT